MRKPSRAAMRQRQGIGARRSALELQAPPPPAAGVGGAAPRATRWQHRASRRAREQQLQRQPLCELRLPGCTGTATEVDHIVERWRGGDLTDPANLRSVCASCHLKRHGKRRRRIEIDPRTGLPLPGQDHPWSEPLAGDEE